MARPQHNRAFLVTVYWTLGLLLLGSVVHATESSLACPDWPTCFGTLVPEMTGGVFWEHLHRLVAGGLILIFGAASYLAWRPEASRPWVRKLTLGGLTLLLVQSVAGGVTVLMRLPDAVSTLHLTLAFLFLALATVLAVVTSPSWGTGHGPSAGQRRSLRITAVPAAALILVQSMVGAAVRHTDAGMACPDVPLCVGEVIPPLSNGLIALHFGHRVLALVVAWAVGWAAWRVVRDKAGRTLERLALASAAAVALQIALGVLSVTSFLAVIPVSAHTLVAATLLVLLTAMATYGYGPVTPAANEATTVVDSAVGDARGG